MRVWEWLCSIFRDPTPAALAEIIASMARDKAEALERLAGLEKQLSDLRAIVAQMGEQAKHKPAVARSMAEIRRFIGANDAD
jgi:hypothetical protein